MTHNSMPKAEKFQKGRDILIRKAPESLHKRIERMIAQHTIKTGKTITKPEACSMCIDLGLNHLEIAE